MNRDALSLGYYSSLTAFAAIVGYSVVQILQIVHLFSFPLDEILIYGFSLCIAIPFLLAVLSLHSITPKEKKIWSGAALLLATMYTVYACFIYVVQLSVVIPNLERGKGSEISLVHLTPHSFFWSLDALAYICLGLSTFFGAFAFSTRPDQLWAKRFFIVNALLTPLIALVYFYPSFSVQLLLLASPWCLTASGSMLLLARVFNRKKQMDTHNTAYESEAIFFSEKLTDIL